MLSFYCVFAVIFMAITYVAILKTENDGAPLMPFQYASVLLVGAFWPIVLVLIIMDFWPREEDDGEDENIE
jgi:hypothetical protein